MDKKSHANFIGGSFVSALLCFVCFYFAPLLDSEITMLLCGVLYVWLIIGVCLTMALFRYTKKQSAQISFFQGFISGLTHMGPLIIVYFIFSDSPAAYLVSFWFIPSPILIAAFLGRNT